MNEELYLKGQRVITPDGEGEVVDAVHEQITVKLDEGETKTYNYDQLQDNSDPG